jgi:hypothetical protein
MGLFPFAATISSMLNPLRAMVTRSRWPEVPWRPGYSYEDLRRSPTNPPRAIPSRLLTQARAIESSVPDRASESIQRSSLSRRHSRTGSALRRWMLPTVERGPPATICV